MLLERVICSEGEPYLRNLDGRGIRDFSASEVAALKYIARNRRSFWRDYPLMISLAAFSLSLATAITSAYLAYRKDLHDQLSELSTTIRTIQELNLKQVEVREKYGGGEYEQRAGSLISNQIYTATLGAADIMTRIGPSASTASIIPISDGLYYYGLFSKAEELAELGLLASRTVQDETTALRALGAMKIRQGSAESIEAGNQYFARAFNFEEKNGKLRFSVASDFIKAGIQLQWADVLASLNCAEAQKHFKIGVEVLEQAGKTLDLDRQRSAARQKYVSGIGSVASCKP